MTHWENVVATTLQYRSQFYSRAIPAKEASAFIERVASEASNAMERHGETEAILVVEEAFDASEADWLGDSYYWGPH